MADATVVVSPLALTAEMKYPPMLSHVSRVSSVELYTVHVKVTSLLLYGIL